MQLYYVTFGLVLIQKYQLKCDKYSFNFIQSKFWLKMAPNLPNFTPNGQHKYVQTGLSKRVLGVRYITRLISSNSTPEFTYFI